MRDMLVESPNVASGSVESVKVFEELERRRKAAEADPSRVKDGEESWEWLRKAGASV